MFNNPHFDRMRWTFADQFQPDGDGYLYRKNLKGAPVRVSKEERQRFVEAFDRGLKRLSWGMTIAVTILLLPVIAAFVLLGAVTDPPTPWLYISVAGVMSLPVVFFTMAMMRLWNAPAIAFATRAPVGRELTRDEARRVHLDRLSWGQLLTGLAAVAFLLFTVHQDYDIFYGWNRVWLALGAAYVGFMAFTAFRKWRSQKL